MKKNLLIILMCLCLPACMSSVQGAEVQDLELSTGDIGAEDISWGTAGDGTADTYSVPYYDGSTATITDVYATDLPFLLLDKAVEDLIDGDLKEYYSTGVVADDITAMGSTATAYIVNRVLNITANTTFNANTVVYVLPGAPFNISAGMTLTPTGGIVAGKYQIVSGTGLMVVPVGAAQEVYPEWWGAAPDNSTDSGAAINAALVATSGTLTSSFIPVMADSGVYICEETVEILFRSVLIGQGRAQTSFKSKDDLNDDLMRTKHFATLTGSGDLHFAGGAPNSFLLRGFKLDGNKANNTSGATLKTYACGFTVDDLYILNSQEEGWYSEYSNITGRVLWYDTPGATITNVFIDESTTIGLHFRGPHDSWLNNIKSRASGTDGAFFETRSDSGTDTSYNFSGTCDIGMLHTYGSDGVGVRVGTRLRADQIYVDNEKQHGIIFQSPSANDEGGRHSRIGQIYCLKPDQDGTATYYGVYVDDDDVQIGMLRVHNTVLSAGGLYINANGLIVSNCVIDGKNKAGVGITHAAGSAVQITGKVGGWNDTGGIGLSTNFANTLNTYDLVISNNETNWENTTAGKRNIYSMELSAGAGQTNYSGVAPSTETGTIWDVIGYDADTSDHYTFRPEHGSLTGTVPSRVSRTRNIEHVLSSQTAGAGATSIWNKTLATQSTYMIKAEVIANGASNSDRAMYGVTGLFYRAAGTATLQGSVQDLFTAVESDAGWACTLAVDGANGVDLNVTGDGANASEWIALIEWIQVHTSTN